MKVLYVVLGIISVGVVLFILNVFVLGPQKVQKGQEILRQSAPPKSQWKQELVAQIGSTSERYVIDTDPNFLIVLGTVVQVGTPLVLQIGNANIEIVTLPETEYLSIVGTNLGSASQASLVEITKGSNVIVRVVFRDEKYVAKYIQIQQ